MRVREGPPTVCFGPSERAALRKTLPSRTFRVRGPFRKKCVVQRLAGNEILFAIRELAIPRRPASLTYEPPDKKKKIVVTLKRLIVAQSRADEIMFSRISAEQENRAFSTLRSNRQIGPNGYWFDPRSSKACGLSVFGPICARHPERFCGERRRRARNETFHISKCSMGAGSAAWATATQAPPGAAIRIDNWPFRFFDLLVNDDESSGPLLGGSRVDERPPSGPAGNPEGFRTLTIMPLSQ